MSILINMKMPTSCAECKFAEFSATEGNRCLINWKPLAYPLTFCPLVPVPEHGDLIDRDPFIDFIKTHWDSYDQWFVDQLEARPTIIPAEEGE